MHNDFSIFPETCHPVLNYEDHETSFNDYSQPESPSVEQMTIIGMTVESEGSVSGHQEAMVIYILLFLIKYHTIQIG